MVVIKEYDYTSYTPSAALRQMESILTFLFNPHFPEWLEPQLPTIGNFDFGAPFCYFPVNSFYGVHRFLFT